MCGRYSQTSELAVLEARFACRAEGVVLIPRPNLTPGQDGPVVDQGRRLRLLRWGLVPAWAKEEKIGSRAINARAETLAAKPAFRDLLERRRCLVPADGFSEWARTGPGPKQPYFFHLRAGGPLALAGLWDRWARPEGGFVESFTIITVAANAEVAPVHGRMPAILRPEDEAAWLAEAAPWTALRTRLAPLPAGLLAVRRVSTPVNRAGLREPELFPTEE